MYLFKSVDCKLAQLFKYVDGWTLDVISIVLSFIMGMILTYAVSNVNLSHAASTTQCVPRSGSTYGQ